MKYVKIEASMLYAKGLNLDYMAGLYLTKVKVYITNLLNVYNLYTKNIMP